MDLIIFGVVLALVVLAFAALTAWADRNGWGAVATIATLLIAMWSMTFIAAVFANIVAGIGWRL